VLVKLVDLFTMNFFLCICIFIYILSLVCATPLYRQWPVDEMIMPPEGCTAIVVGADASTDGPMTTHTNDCKDCDFR
jgi:hypothetical protein